MDNKKDIDFSNMNELGNNSYKMHLIYCKVDNSFKYVI